MAEKKSSNQRIITSPGSFLGNLMHMLKFPEANEGYRGHAAENPFDYHRALLEVAIAYKYPVKLLRWTNDVDFPFDILTDDATSDKISKLYHLGLTYTTGSLFDSVGNGFPGGALALIDNDPISIGSYHPNLKIREKIDFDFLQSCFLRAYNFSLKRDESLGVNYRDDRMQKLYKNLMESGITPLELGDMYKRMMKLLQKMLRAHPKLRP